MFGRIILYIAFFFGIISSAFSSDQFSEMTLLKNQIEASYYSFDLQKLKNTHQSSLLLKKKYSKDWHTYYYCGLIELVIGKVYYQIDQDIAWDYFNKSIDELEKAKELSNNPEINALLSSAYSKKSSLKAITAIFYGIKAKDLIYEAYNNDKANPKVLLIAATHLMHTPSQFGGDKSKARQLLIKCLELNKKTTNKDALLVQWAMDAEVYAYLAQLEILNGNKQAAMDYIQKALQIAPDYGFVKKDLMPQYNKIK